MNIMTWFVIFFVVNGVWVFDCTAAETDKTLVAWVSLNDLEGAGGSVLTLQRGDQFDAIVFGELKKGKWMAGSNYFKRTSQEQDYPREAASNNELIQVAIVYKDNLITLFRNGKPLTSYHAQNIDLLSGKNQAIVFGLRHLVGGNGYIEGAIDDARIYARALSADEIQSFHPNQPSPIKPWCWWDFEGEKIKDRAERFTHTRMAGGAKLIDGRLSLKRTSIVVATQNEETMDWAEWSHASLVNMEAYEPETPAMPDEIPDHWLTYHLVHPGPGRAVPGDPNAAFYYKGVYHLHYIYRNKYGYNFAHLSSQDLVWWKWHPTTLSPPMTGHGMFSGTGFFTKEGKPAAIYHGVGSGKNWIVYGQNDSLEKWSEPQLVTAYTADGGEADIRYWDPDCWLRDGTYYAISGGRPPLLMKSDDLKEWDFVGNLFHDDTNWDTLGVKPEEDVSCANMFKIGGAWMLLCISHDLGCRYYLGDFKGDQYLPASHKLMSWNNNNFFAPESLLTKDGRRVMWAWLTHEGLHPTGVQSLPRELELTHDGQLKMKPLQELTSLRYDTFERNNLVIASGENVAFHEIKGDALEFAVHVASPVPEQFSIQLLTDKNGRNGLEIAAGAKRKSITIGKNEIPFVLSENEDLTLRLFVDKNLIEVFANDRQAAAVAHTHYQDHPRFTLSSKGGDTVVRSLRAWKMRSIHNYSNAEKNTIK